MLEKISNQIELARIKKNYSISKLCDKAGITRSQYYGVRSANINYTIDTLTKLVDVLEIEYLNFKI